MHLSEDTQHLSPFTELVREVVGNYPFGRGTSRIASFMGTLLLRDRKTAAIGKVGCGSTLCFWPSEEFNHPTFWYLYEAPVRRELKNLLSPGSVYIDVGAHRGWLAGLGLALVSPGGLVIACEPFPPHAERLRALASLNPGKNLIIENVAVTRAAGTAVLMASNEHQGTVHTIVPAFAVKVPAERRPLEVPTMSLDEIAARHAVFEGNGRAREVIVKIDAEGAELDVLLGASQTLAQPSLKALIIEVAGSGPDGLTERSEECLDILRASDFTLRVLTRKIGSRRVEQKGRALNPADLDDELNILAVRENPH